MNLKLWYVQKIVRSAVYHRHVGEGSVILVSSSPFTARQHYFSVDYSYICILNLLMFSGIHFHNKG